MHNSIADCSSAADPAAVGASPALAYCWPEMFLAAPGLGHMKEIVRTLLLEAAGCGRVALLPPLCSNRQHNPGRRGILEWSDYFDWSGLSQLDPHWHTRSDLVRTFRAYTNVRLLAGTYSTTLSEERAGLVVRHFGHSHIFGEWIGEKEAGASAGLCEPVFSARFPASIEDGARKVLEEIGVPVGVLHVRRGDVAGPHNDPPAVLQHLHTQGCTPLDRILILTNETSRAFRIQIQHVFPRAIFEQDVICLQRVQQETSDNYRIYRIGKCIQSQHDHLSLGSLRALPVGAGRPTPPGLLFRALCRCQQYWNRPRMVRYHWLENCLRGTRAGRGPIQ